MHVAPPAPPRLVPTLYAHRVGRVTSSKNRRNLSRIALRFPAKRGSVSTRVYPTEATRKETTMNPAIGQQLAQLQRLTTPQLRMRYAELFGEHTPANNRTWLFKRIAWRLQALAEGGLSERARQRAAELANDADLRMNPPVPPRPAQPVPPQRPVPTDPAATGQPLPPAGTILPRMYKGETLQCPVRQRGC